MQEKRVNQRINMDWIKEITTSKPFKDNTQSHHLKNLLEKHRRIVKL